MRTIFLILLHTFLSLISCGFVDNDIKKEAEKLLIGRWVLTTDKNFVMDIRIDSIVYYYNGQVDMSNPIAFVFEDSLNNYYEAKNSRFDFIRNGELLSKISIKEFETASKDTIVNTVVYLDKKGLDIVSRNRSVSFKRLEN
jgi:hypothetical protein